MQKFSLGSKKRCLEDPEVDFGNGIRLIKRRVWMVPWGWCPIRIHIQPPLSMISQQNSQAKQKIIFLYASAFSPWDSTLFLEAKNFHSHPKAWQHSILIHFGWFHCDLVVFCSSFEGLLGSFYTLTVLLISRGAAQEIYLVYCALWARTDFLPFFHP